MTVLTLLSTPATCYVKLDKYVPVIGCPAKARTKRSEGGCSTGNGTYVAPAPGYGRPAKARTKRSEGAAGAGQRYRRI